MKMPLSNLALVICSKDRPELLAETLRGHLRQHALPGYIVVVDSSEDVTVQKAIISELTFDNPHIKFKLLRSTPGLPLQRKVGFTFLLENCPSVNIVSFLDDDISLVDNLYFHTVVELMNSRKKLVALSGFIVDQKLGVGARLLQWILGAPFLQGRIARSGLASLPQPKADRELTRVGWCQGGMISIRVKEELVDVFPVALRMYGEDLELSLRLKEFGELAISPLLPVRHSQAQSGKHASDSVAYFTGAALYGLSRRHPAYVDTKFVVLSLIRLVLINLVGAFVLLDPNRLGLARGYARVSAHVFRQRVREDTV